MCIKIPMIFESRFWELWRLRAKQGITNVSAKLGRSDGGKRLFDPDDSAATPNCRKTIQGANGKKLNKARLRLLFFSARIGSCCAITRIEEQQSCSESVLCFTCCASWIFFITFCSGTPLFVSLLVVLGFCILLYILGILSLILL